MDLLWALRLASVSYRFNSTQKLCISQFQLRSARVIFRNCYMSEFHEPNGSWNLRQFWNITSGIYAKYCIQIMLLFVYTTTRKRFVIFTFRYFKLSWDTAALSQSYCRNFWCSSIKQETRRRWVPLMRRSRSRGRNHLRSFFLVVACVKIDTKMAGYRRLERKR